MALRPFLFLRRILCYLHNNAWDDKKGIEERPKREPLERESMVITHIFLQRCKKRRIRIWILKYLTELWEECGALAYLSDPQIGLTFRVHRWRREKRRREPILLFDGWDSSWYLHSPCNISGRIGRRCIRHQKDASSKTSCPFLCDPKNDLFFIPTVSAPSLTSSCGIPPEKRDSGAADPRLFRGATAPNDPSLGSSASTSADNIPFQKT